MPIVQPRVERLCLGLQIENEMVRACLFLEQNCGGLCRRFVFARSDEAKSAVAQLSKNAETSHRTWDPDLRG